MRLLVTGASGFVGAHFCREAVKNHKVFGVHFRTPIRLGGLTPIRFDLSSTKNRAPLESLDVDAVVHLAAKIKAPAQGSKSSSEVALAINRRMMDTVLSLGKPILYASSTVVHWSSDCPYALSRREDEARITASGLPFAILRPSAPYGPKFLHHKSRHKESFHTLTQLVRISPFVPMIGSGEYRRQPIHVEDFARFGLSLLELGLPNRAFEAGGGSVHSFREIIELLANGMGKVRRCVSIPKFLFVQLAKLRPDFDPDLMNAVDSDEVADPSDLISFTGHTPRTFSEGLRDLVNC